jgi:hypothetical protein
MGRFRAIAAILMLILMMPLAHARAIISSAAVAQRDCCRQKADSCCERPEKACCVTQAPANPALFPSQGVAPSLLSPTAVPVVHADRIDSLNVPGAARNMPAEHSPPGLLMVVTTILRI